MTDHPRHSLRRRTLLTVATAAVLTLAAAGASAQVGVTAVQRSFINLGFESPSLGTTPCRLYIGEEYVPGWTTSHTLTAQENSGCVGFDIPGFTTAPARILEIWRGPRNNNTGNVAVPARSGTQFAELNAAQSSRISQNVCLEPNDDIRWRLSHRGRNSANQMNFLIGEALIVQVESNNTGTGAVVQIGQGTALPPNNSGIANWLDYEGQFNYAGIPGVTNIGFEAVGGTTEGNFLDDIQVFLKPFIELASGTYRTTEGESDGLPTLRIAGTVDADIDVIIRVLPGGSAVLGADFTTPSGSDTFTVRIPTGTYDGISLPLGLAAIGNSLFDGTRTVQLQLEVDEDTYFTRSTSVCGDPGVAQALWEILDDDVDLAIVKTASAASAALGETIGYILTVTSDAAALVDADGAIVRDPAIPGLDCTAAVPTCSASNGAACPADVSIGILQGAGAVIPTLPPSGQIELTFECVVTASPGVP